MSEGAGDAGRVLLAEHELLGASMGAQTEGGVPVPLSYLNEKPIETALADGAALVDLTGATYVLAEGTSVASLAGLAFAGRRLAPGECAFEAVLGGDGALLSVPLVLRTGDAEYVMLDLSPRGETALAWLGFLAGVGNDGRRAFPDASLNDATEMLVPLLLWGARAETVLEDYLSGEERLPEPGSLAQLLLDRIPVVVAGVPVDGGGPCHLLLVPPARARALWRSLLSFPEVEPVGHVGLASGVASRLPWWDALAGEGVLREPRRTLEGWGTVRADGGFVGFRGLEG